MGAPTSSSANPPYLVDEDRRLYRHGGGELGITLALRIAKESMAKLVPGGCLVLYSGTPIVNGADALLQIFAACFATLCQPLRL